MDPLTRGVLIFLASLIFAAPSLALTTSRFVDTPDQVINQYKLTRDLITDRWNQTSKSNLLCAAATFHGFVPKLATLAQSPTIRLGTPERDTFIGERLPIYSGCQVLISHRWRFIYIRQPKSSSTAVLAALKSLLCSPNPASCAPNVLATAPAVIDSETWRTYFVFTIVRNPWIRTLSAYNMFSKHFLRRRQGSGIAGPGEKCTVPFEEFARDTNAMRAACEGAGGCCSYLPGVRKFIPTFLNVHIADQAHCVFLPGGESLVDFVGATESLDEDWMAVVAEIDRRTNSTLSARAPTHLRNPNGHGPAVAGQVETLCDDPSVREKLNDAAVYGIAKQYAMDVVRFGFL